MHHSLPLCAVVLLTLALACGGGESIQSSLRAAADGGRPMYGHQDDLMYGHSWNATADADSSLTRSDIQDVCGDYPAILGLDMGGIENGAKCNLDGNDFGIQRLAAIRHFERGGIVTLSWHVRNPLTGGSAWDISSDRAVRSVLAGGSGHELFLGWLDRLADWIESLKTADGRMVPVLFRPWHEHSGSWFWWGQDLCTAQEYKALWKMTYEYLTITRGLKQISWAISPNYTDTDFKDWEDRYPGDEYVDVIGLDCYASADSVKFIGDMRKGLTALEEMCRTHGKILAVTETGCEGIPDPKWWTEVLSPAIKGFPVSYILTWRNASDRPGHYFAPFKGEASAPDFSQWTKTDHITLLQYDEIQ